MTASVYDECGLEEEEGDDGLEEGVAAIEIGGGQEPEGYSDDYMNIAHDSFVHKNNVRPVALPRISKDTH